MVPLDVRGILECPQGHMCADCPGVFNQIGEDENSVLGEIALESWGSQFSGEDGAYFKNKFGRGALFTCGDQYFQQI